MRLNLETRLGHAAVDRPWLDLLRPSVTTSDYLTRLVRTYGLIAPFESACRYAPGVAGLLENRQLTRAGLIAQDLVALDLSAAQIARIPTCPSLAMFRTATEALGWLYVIERTTLLADGIRRHLQRYLPVEHACNFLAAFDGQLGEHWKTFGRVLGQFAGDTSIATEIVSAAQHGFSTASEWFRDDVRRAS